MIYDEDWGRSAYSRAELNLIHKSDQDDEHPCCKKCRFPDFWQKRSKRLCTYLQIPSYEELLVRMFLYRELGYTLVRQAGHRVNAEFNARPKGKALNKLWREQAEVARQRRGAAG